MLYRLSSPIIYSVSVSEISSSVSVFNSKKDSAIMAFKKLKLLVAFIGWRALLFYENNETFELRINYCVSLLKKDLVF